MAEPPLLSESALAQSEVVANSAMNRERRLRGTNSYAKELGFDPLEAVGCAPGRPGRWLDLCCGTGRALIEATLIEGGAVRILGVDLVPHFDPVPPAAGGLRLEVADLSRWSPGEAFDLITCVHGLHYVGDKLGLLARLSAWLTPEGRFAAHLDLENIHIQGDAGHRALRAWLRASGFTYEGRRHLLQRRGPARPELPFRFLGAEDGAGPNYTGQPAVRSHYALRTGGPDSEAA